MNKENNEDFGWDDGPYDDMLDDLMKDLDLFGDNNKAKTENKTKTKVNTKSKSKSKSNGNTKTTTKTNTNNNDNANNSNNNKQLDEDKSNVTLDNTSTDFEKSNVSKDSGEDNIEELTVDNEAVSTDTVETIETIESVDNLFATFNVKHDVKSIDDEQIEFDEDGDVDNIDFSTLIHDDEVINDSTKPVTSAGYNDDNNDEQIGNDDSDEEIISNGDSNRWANYNNKDRVINKQKNKENRNRDNGNISKWFKGILKAIISLIILGLLIIGITRYLPSNDKEVTQDEIINDYALLSSSIDDTLFNLSLYLNNRISDDILFTQLEAEVLPHSLSDNVNKTIDDYKVIHQNLQNGLKSASTTNQVDVAIDTYVKDVTSLEITVNEVFKNEFNNQDIEYIEATDGSLDIIQ